MQTHIPMWIINEIPQQRIWALNVMNEVTWFLFNINEETMSAEFFKSYKCFSFSAWLIMTLKIFLRSCLRSILSVTLQDFHSYLLCKLTQFLSDKNDKDNS